MALYDSGRPANYQRLVSRTPAVQASTGLYVSAVSLASKLNERVASLQEQLNAEKLKNQRLELEREMEVAKAARANEAVQQQRNQRAEPHGS